MRVRPENGLQGYFATITPGQVTVTGCLMSEVPQPEATIAPALTVTNDVTYAWNVKLDSDAADPLVVQYDKPVDVPEVVPETDEQARRFANAQVRRDGRLKTREKLASR